MPYFLHGRRSKVEPEAKNLECGRCDNVVSHFLETNSRDDDDSSRSRGSVPVPVLVLVKFLARRGQLERGGGKHREGTKYLLVGFLHTTPKKTEKNL